MTKSPFLKEDVPLLKVYVLTKKALKYMKQNLIQLKGEIVKSTVKAEFNTSLSVIDRPSRQIINKDMRIFASMFISDIGQQFSFCVLSVWFWFQGDGGLVECVWKCSFL